MVLPLLSTLRAVGPVSSVTVWAAVSALLLAPTLYSVTVAVSCTQSPGAHRGVVRV
jgi:hypothetical protein